MNSQMNSSEMTNEFVINYIISLPIDMRDNVLLKINQAIFQNEQSAVAAPLSTSEPEPELKPEPEQKAEPEPEQKIENEPEQKIEDDPCVNRYEHLLTGRLHQFHIILNILKEKCESGQFTFVKMELKNGIECLTFRDNLNEYDYELDYKSLYYSFGVFIIDEFTSCIRKKWKQTLIEYDMFKYSYINNAKYAKIYCFKQCSSLELNKLNIKNGALGRNEGNIDILHICPTYNDFRKERTVFEQLLTKDFEIFQNMLITNAPPSIPIEDCPCCMEPTMTVVNKCKHPLCRVCSLKIKNGRNKKCPLCRGKIDKIVINN